MAINLGLDIGAVGLKLAVVASVDDRPLLEALCAAHPEFRFVEEAPSPLVVSDYRRVAGSPIESTYNLLHSVYESIPESRIEGIRVTGSGSRTIAKILGIYYENEFKATAHMVSHFYPDVRTVFEIGGESSRYMRLERHRGRRGEHHRRLRAKRRVRGRHRFVPRPAGAPDGLFGRGDGRGRVHRDLGGADRGPVLGVRQVGHDPRAAERQHPGRDPARAVPRRRPQLQEQRRQGPDGQQAGAFRGSGRMQRRRRQRAARGLRARRTLAYRAAALRVVRGHRRGDARGGRSAEALVRRNPPSPPARRAPEHSRGHPADAGEGHPAARLGAAVRPAAGRREDRGLPRHRRRVGLDQRGRHQRSR